MMIFRLINLGNYDMITRGPGRYCVFRNYVLAQIAQKVVKFSMFFEKWSPLRTTIKHFVKNRNFWKMESWIFTKYRRLHLTFHFLKISIFDKMFDCRSQLWLFFEKEQKFDLFLSYLRHIAFPEISWYF